MPNIQPVTRNRYADKRWLPKTKYHFAARDMVCPVVTYELSKAMMAMPLGFVEGNDGYRLVAVLGLEPKKNLFVAGDGRWLGRYIPLVYRWFPFMLAKSDEDKQVLCLDEDFDICSDDPQAQPFYDDEGKPAAEINRILESLTRFQKGRQATTQFCKILSDLDLVKPWDLSIKHPQSGKELKVDGLYCIDEIAFNDLDDQSFLKIRQSGALPIVYCQLLSMLHIGQLLRLTKDRSSVIRKEAGELDFNNEDNSGSISFDNL